jgi:hypothetical protein
MTTSNNETTVTALIADVTAIIQSFSNGHGSPMSDNWGNPSKRVDLLGQIDCEQLESGNYRLGGVIITPAQLLAQLYFWAWKTSGYESVESQFQLTAASATCMAHFNKLKDGGATVAVDKTAPYKTLFEQLGVVQVATVKGSSRWSLFMPTTKESKAALLDAGFAIAGSIMDEDGLDVVGFKVEPPKGE